MADWESWISSFCECCCQRRQWHPTPVLLPGKSHGRRSLVGCSPWGCWGSDTTERLPFHFSLSFIGEGNGNPLQCSCLENPRDEGAWWAAVYGVAQSRTRLKRRSSSSSSAIKVGDHWARESLYVHAQLHLTLCDLMNRSPPGFSVHGIFQARTLERLPFPPPGGSSQSRDWSRVSYVSCTACAFFTTEPLEKSSRKSSARLLFLS